MQTLRVRKGTPTAQSANRYWLQPSTGAGEVAQELTCTACPCGGDVVAVWPLTASLSDVLAAIEQHDRDAHAVMTARGGVR